MSKALTYIEIDVPFCANTYGESPCTAAIGVTGSIKCFNSPNTCQDREHYIDDPVVFRFAEDIGYLPDDIDCIPSIVNIAFTPALVSLGKDLGTRASIQVTFKDHKWADAAVGYDKYVTERPYNPFEQGTYWGKFRARQPFLRGRQLRLIRGFLGQSLENMETRYYIIDSFNHNAENGTYSIIAKDVLKLADDDRAQAPAISSGVLSSDLNETDTQIVLSPEGIGAEEYPASGYIAIGGKEICSFVRAEEFGGNDTNTVLLLHMDGVDGAQVFDDASASNHAADVGGQTHTDTAQSKFGGASGLFDGVGDDIEFLDSDDWTPAGDFTVDFWARWNALAATQFLFVHNTGTNDSNRYALTVSSAGALNFIVRSGGSTIVTMTSAAAAVAADGNWYHIAVVRLGDDWDIYVNGISVASVNDNSAIPNYTDTFRIAEDNNGANNFNGWIDEFRFSHIARWSANFTPPAFAYESDSDTLSIVRGQLGTEAIDHDANDRVQLVLLYSSQDAADIIRDLLVNYAGVDDSFIPISSWQSETASFLNRLFTAVIAEPTGVKKLLSELIEDAALCLWWDDVSQLIRLRVLRAISTEAAIFDRDKYLEGSFSSQEQPNERLSQIWRYFAKRNPLEGQDDPDNYRSVIATVDLEAETDYGSSVIHKIYSRWIGVGGRSIAEKANDLYLSRFRDPPRQFSFATFRDGVLIPDLGGGYRIKGLGIQDATGAEANAPIQITKLNPTSSGFIVEAEEMLASVSEENLADRVVTIDSDIFNVNLRELHDVLFPEPGSSGELSGTNVTCIIDDGVIVGSSSVNLPAFDVGDWPVGFPVTIIVNGRIQGAGGTGGNDDERNGLAGGVALYTRHDIDIEVGEIWGGGGGGGIGSTTRQGGITINGGEGGGGAGQIGGTSSGGSDGTSEEGGEGGEGSFHDAHGGAGGDPGESGQPGLNVPTVIIPAGLGSAAGAAIDGVSFVTVTVGPGDIRGPEIN